MIPRIRPLARLLLALSLLVSWTTSGWAAACAQRPAQAQTHAMAHRAAHGGGMHGHHSRPAPAPEPGDRGPAGEMPECPLLAMNGGTCTGVAQLPSIVTSHAVRSMDVRGYPPVEAIRDRLLTLSLFRPPEA
ncbi:MAG TPA: hypothetical protein VGB15_05075 [Longimicrobium sp.]|jgi:hypothetical protein